MRKGRFWRVQTLRTHPFRVSLADPHPITLDGLARVFAGSRRFEVVSAATSSRAAFEDVTRTRPELFVTDLHLPCEGGLALLTELARAGIHPRVVVFADALPDDAIRRARAFGIGAFVSKGLGGDVIVEESIRAVAFMTSDAPVVRGFEDPCGSDRLDVLSARERHILTLGARGLSNKEIACTLGITPGTVKVHLHAIYRKLGVTRRAELTRFSNASARLLQAV